jgi:hypothetical protein
MVDHCSCASNKLAGFEPAVAAVALDGDFEDGDAPCFGGDENESDESRDCFAGDFEVGFAAEAAPCDCLVGDEKNILDMSESTPSASESSGALPGGPLLARWP